MLTFRSVVCVKDLASYYISQVSRLYKWTGRVRERHVQAYKRNNNIYTLSNHHGFMTVRPRTKYFHIQIHFCPFSLPFPVFWYRLLLVFCIMVYTY